MKRIHFIGIGGIGLSALAQYLKKLGYEVSGSDLKPTILTDKLIAEGIEVSIPHKKENITNQDLVVYTSIVSMQNIEILEAQKQNINILSRKDFLPEILQDKKVYSVCGAHGKSTTTAILASIFKESTAIIGAECKSFGSNMRFGEDNKKIIFEADESDISFLNSNPYCAIVTNAEPEHMESYDYDYDLFYKCYADFIDKASFAVINAEDKFLSTLNKKHIQKLYPSKDIRNIKYKIIDNNPYTSFELKNLGVFEVWGIGEYIAIDASLAILASLKEKSIEDIRKDIKGFQGIKKRFDIINNNKSIVIDDYGHHPTEIKATLSSIKQYASMLDVNKVTAIWQPHKYSRTIDNMKSFTQCFKDSDELIILPVWAAGESKVDIDFEKYFSEYCPVLADKISVEGDEVSIMRKDKIIKTINNGLIVGFGAGDITYQLRGA